MPCRLCRRHGLPRRPTGAGSRRAGGRRLDERIDALVTLRDGLDSCIGCGCLSLQTCPLSNPDDIAASSGIRGAAYLPALLNGAAGSARPRVAVKPSSSGDEHVGRGGLEPVGNAPDLNPHSVGGEPVADLGDEFGTGCSGVVDERVYPYLASHPSQLTDGGDVELSIQPIGIREEQARRRGQLEGAGRQRQMGERTRDVRCWLGLQVPHEAFRGGHPHPHVPLQTAIERPVIALGMGIGVRARPSGLLHREAGEVLG